MKTKDNIIEMVNKLLKEDLTSQFYEKEELTEYGDITIVNSKGEFVELQACIFNFELHFVITGYKFLLVKD